MKTKPSISIDKSGVKFFGCCGNGNWLNRTLHKLFFCPTFWRIKPRFKCPACGKTYRCYWDGNDVEGLGIDYCNKCVIVYEAGSPIVDCDGKVKVKDTTKRCSA